jgi:predicted nucleotidyltransferase component of viral defense system
MFERFLARLSQSKYRDSFVIKGGMLIAAIVGLDTRSTMDLDTTLRGLPLTKEKVLDAVNAINEIVLGDDVSFEIKSIDSIRKDDRYGGFCVRIDAFYDTMVTPLSIDVSTGDVITPGAVLYEFGSIFDEDVNIPLWGYNIETVMAEKVETILRRGVFNTRPRDFYDAYILTTTQKFDKAVFADALKATVNHRGTAQQIEDVSSILRNIEESPELKTMWDKYRKQFAYAKDIEYGQIIETFKLLLCDNKRT